MSYKNRKKNKGFFRLFICVLSVAATGISCGSRSTSGEGICGNGILEGNEECDDGNLVDGDGCDHLCRIEEGWQCEGQPSVCTEICGDGLIVGGELCDGDNLDGETCESLGLESGDLGCNDECTFDVSECTGEAVCGNGIWEYPEECDGDDFRNATCESLGFEGGTLACNEDCTLDTSGCETASICGNGIQEPGEECDGDDLAGESCQSLGFENGDLGCNEDCTFDTSECTGEGPFCGNGVIDEGEECDGDDLGGQTCEDLGFDGGALGCDDYCKLDTSGCVDCGNLEYCDGVCVDVRAHMDHCGQCDNPCDSDQVCTGGLCADLDGEWTLVPFPEDVERFSAHDLASDDEHPYVAVVAGGAGNTHRVVVARHDGTEWDVLGPSPNQEITDNLESNIALALDGTKPYVLFSRTTMAIDQPNLHLMQRTDDGWEQVGAPGYQTPCAMHSHLDMVFEEDVAHLVYLGSLDCGLGTGYAWYDGGWNERPSVTAHNGQICEQSVGRPAVVHTDRPYVGVGYSSMLMQTVRSMVWWDEQDELWTDLVEPLETYPGDGRNEHISAVSDNEGNIYVAWSVELKDEIPTRYAISVKKYHVSDSTWRFVGQEHVETSESANDPSIALIGGNLWLAYTSVSTFAITPPQVLVMRFSESDQRWEQVGGPLNENNARDAHIPVIAGAGGVPYVAFRENTQGGRQTFYVKRYVAPQITPP